MKRFDFCSKVDKQMLFSRSVGIGAQTRERGAGSTLPSECRGHRLPISEVIEPAPFVDRSRAHTAMKVAGVSPRLLLLARRVDSRAVRAGEIDDQLEIVTHAPMMP